MRVHCLFWSDYVTSELIAVCKSWAETYDHVDDDMYGDWSVAIFDIETGKAVGDWHLIGESGTVGFFDNPKHSRDVDPSEEDEERGHA